MEKVFFIFIVKSEKNIAYHTGYFNGFYEVIE